MNAAVPSAPSSPSTAELVTRYAARFDAVVGTTGHTVSSPLGAWLLVALAAPLTTGDDRAAVEEVLGTTADDAHERAVELLSHPHDAVAHAVAIWQQTSLVRPAFVDWARTLDGSIATGPIPSPAVADHWAYDHTGGMIERFPVQIDPLTAIVLASALATQVRWTESFVVVSSLMLRNDFTAEPEPASWAARVREVLATPERGHDVCVFSTAAAGEVGVHAARSTDGLIVVSVIADANVARADVRTAAHDVACALVDPDATRAQRIGLADLALGAGPAWHLSEEMVDADEEPEPEVSEAYLPAWAAEAQHDLLAPAAPGVADTLAALSTLVDDSAGPPSLAAAQGAVARYTAEGFQAAAVTGLGARALSIPERTVTQRWLTVWFDRPYAVVAVALDRDDPRTRDTGTPPPSVWHGMPVFSAFVEEPAEAG